MKFQPSTRLSSRTKELGSKNNSKTSVKQSPSRGLCVLEQVLTLGSVEMLEGGCRGNEYYLSLGDYRDGGSAERPTWGRKSSVGSWNVSFWCV